MIDAHTTPEEFARIVAKATVEECATLTHNSIAEQLEKISKERFLDYHELAAYLGIYKRDRSAPSTDGARRFVSDTPELKALCNYIGPKQPRWRLSDVEAWLAQSKIRKNSRFKK